MDESNHGKMGGKGEGGADRPSTCDGIVRRWKWPVRLAAGAGALGTVFAMLCPMLPERTDVATVAVTHAACMLRTFGLQCGIGALLGAGVALLLRRRRSALVAVIAAAVWLVPEGLRWMPRNPPKPTGADMLTVLSVNALYGRSDAKLIAGEARACAADIVVFQEYTPELAQSLRSELPELPYRIEMARDDAFGQAVFSRRPFVGQPRVQPTWSRQPQITVTVILGGAPVSVTNVHLLPPTGLSMVAEQRSEALGLAREVTGSPQVDRVLAGDFNATMDGRVLSPLVAAGLRDSWSAAQRGRGGTWPADHAVLSRLGRVRIDNLLHSSTLRCIAAGVGEKIGSDHLPTWARYQRGE